MSKDQAETYTRNLRQEKQQYLQYRDKMRNFMNPKSVSTTKSSNLFKQMSSGVNTLQATSAFEKDQPRTQTVHYED